MPVTFDEAKHKYTSHRGEDYISVTTLIGKYVPPFDANYWSTYKAMKDVFTAHGEWEAYKRKVGGWENVVPYVREIDKEFPLKTDVLAKKNEYLRMWKENKEDAAEKGTAFHKKRESTEAERATILPGTTAPLPILSSDPIADRNITDSGVYTELLIYHDGFGIAGQADWVMRNKDHITIRDYKTSKSIERKAFQDETLFSPVSHLPNANFYTYSLQLSLYGWLLEQAGYKVDKLEIEHVDRHTQDTIEIIPVNYYKSEVEAIVKHYSEERKRDKEFA